jgi:hypothetical protein
LVVPADEELASLTDRFVCVRRIQMGDVDLSTFQFDPFLSWSLFFMNADKTIYGRYGRAHPETKRAVPDSNPNPTVTGMKAAMRRALEIHGDYAKDPRTWGKVLAGKTGPEPKWRYTMQTPSARKYKRMKIVKPGEEKGCVHCHEVQRAYLDSMLMTRKRIPDNQLWLYPRPQVLGLEMDGDHCAKVTRVEPGSAASVAGIKPGDEIRTLGGQPLVSIADLQWVLQNFPDEGGKLPATISRGGKPESVEMTLFDGWRLTEDWGWRYRVAGYASWLWTGVSFKDTPEGILVTQRSPNWWKKPNRDARRALKPRDVIVKVDGETGMSRSDFLAYLIRDKKLGSTVTLEIRRKGRREMVRFKIPSKQPEILGH